MDFIEIFVLVLYICIIGFFIFLALFYKHPKAPKKSDIVPSYQNAYEEFTFWEADDKTTNACKTYTFKPGLTSETECGFNKGINSNISLKYSILSTITPEAIGTCYDVDQIVAKKVKRICQTTADIQAALTNAENAKGEKGKGYCIKENGDQALVGQSEDVYESTCNVQPCAGTLSLLLLNYKPKAVCNTPKAIVIESDGKLVLKTPNLIDNTQYFRVVRADIGKTPDTVGIDKGKSGRLVQLLHRSTNSYLEVISGILSSKGKGGAKWILIQTLVSATNISPQQLVWGGDLTLDNIKSIYSVKSVDEFFTLATTLGLKSLQWDGVATTPSLLPFYKQAANVTPGAAYQRATSQYVNVTLYNSIMFNDKPVSF